MESFQYLLADKEVHKLPMDSVKEFGFNEDGIVYRRFTVKIDRSPKTDKERNPRFETETLLLNRLVQGRAVLYEVADGIRRYFYALSDDAIPQQLVYKVYVPTNAQGGTGAFSIANDQYKQQLLVDFKCSAIDRKSIEILKYERKPLIKIFTTYNNCMAGIEEKK